MDRAAEINRALRALLESLSLASDGSRQDVIAAVRKAAVSAGVGFVHTPTVTTPREGSESQ